MTKEKAEAVETCSIRLFNNELLTNLSDSNFGVYIRGIITPNLRIL